MTSTTSHASSPVRLSGELDPNLSRWLWLVKMFLAVPHYVVLAFLWAAFLWAAFLVATVVAGIAILLTGRYPRSLFWLYRVLTYVALMHDDYPPFRLDQGQHETAPASIPAHDRVVAVR